MSSHYFVPTFNKGGFFSNTNKVHKDLTVTDQSTVAHPPKGSCWCSAIATESIPSTVDGEYVFAVRIDNIVATNIMIGVTPMETFDSDAESSPGSNGMTGCALYLYYGNYVPGSNQNLVDATITKKAKEVIVVVTIVNSGAQKFIRWIIDGTSSVNRDSTDHCKGDKLFPVVTMFDRNQQVTMIPIDQIMIRNDEVNKIIEKFSKSSSSSPNQSNAAVANNNNQQQPSTAAIAQLQLELEKERKRADLAEAELKQKDQIISQQSQELQNEKKLSASRQQIAEAQREQNLQIHNLQIQAEKQVLASRTIQQINEELQGERKQAEMKLQQQSSEIAQLKQQLLTLQSQLNNNANSLVPASPFVKDKLYQIDFAVNGITPPVDHDAFGTLLKLPSQNNSVLFQHVKNELWKKLGSMIPSPKSVSDFTLESIEVIYSDIAMLEGRMRRLQQLRSQNGNFFNPPTGAFTAEQLHTLIALRDQFLPRSSNADPKSPNLINVFHGTKVDRLQSVVNGLVAVRSTDAGYFGSGVYTTTSIEYAAKYAKGVFDFKNGPYPPRASDGCVPVVWCVAAVGVCYPLTREVDYSKKRVHDGMGVSDFFGAPLTPGYDCHCVAVNESVGFQAVPRKDMQYMEVVFDQEIQVLPIAVLWVKSM